MRSVVGGSGYYEVAHDYARVAPSGGWNLIRRTFTTLPDSVSGSPGTVTVAFNYGSGLNDSISRVNGRGEVVGGARPENSQW